MNTIIVKVSFSVPALWPCKQNDVWTYYVLWLEVLLTPILINSSEINWNITQAFWFINCLMSEWHLDWMPQMLSRIVEAAFSIYGRNGTTHGQMSTYLYSLIIYKFIYLLVTCSAHINTVHSYYSCSVLSCRVDKLFRSSLRVTFWHIVDTFMF